MPETTAGSVHAEVNGIPEHGKFTAEVFARFFEIEVKTLKDRMMKHGIRYLPFGSTWVIVAEWFWADLAKAGNAELSE